MLVAVTMTFTSTGCSTTKTVVERDTVTIVQNQGDSVITDSKISIKDSVRIKDSTVVHVNENGDVIKTESWHNREHISITKDSTSYYRAKYDSLYTAYTKLRNEKKQTVNTAISTKEKMKATASGVFYGSILGFIVAVLLWYCIRKKSSKPP